jgi:hypothetical protein
VQNSFLLCLYLKLTKQIPFGLPKLTVPETNFLCLRDMCVVLFCAERSYHPETVLRRKTQEANDMAYGKAIFPGRGETT